MKYTIKTITGALEFRPTTLELLIGDKFTVTETIEEEVQENDFIRVTAILTQSDSNGVTQRSANHVFPFATWEGLISGYDPNLKEPILDNTKLNTILATFNLELT